MQTIEILYFGKHPEIRETVLRLINGRQGWSGQGAADIGEATSLIETRSYNILLLGCGIPEAEEQALRTWLRAARPGIRIVQHYGGGSGLLYAGIMEALRQEAV